jgi:ribosomal protein L40E
MGKNETDLIEEEIATLRALLLEALQAGLFLSEDATWRPHHNGEILYFADRAFGIERPAVLVLSKDLTDEILSDSVQSDFRSYVVIGGRLTPEVDLGGYCAMRAVRMVDSGENYWASFVLDGNILATAGTPLSWCRLVGEVLNAQVSAPFVQQRLCSRCHALNAYRNSVCERCGKPLTLTGKLG